MPSLPAEIDPEEIPPADAVAHALVAAARVTGENPLVVAHRTGRFRIPALAALRAYYPLCPAHMIARYVGLPDGYPAAVAMAKKAAWWPRQGEPAVVAAMAVLEGL